MQKRRLPAEWEPQSAVQFTFPHQETDWVDILEEVIPCFVACIMAVSRFERVVVVCSNVAETQAYFPTGALSGIQFVECPSNDTWARDHGGITLFEDGKPVILDFVFNGWGLKFPANLDNLITGKLHQLGVFHAPVRPGGLALEGGGIESDGQGTLLTTSECLLSPNRNPHLDKTATEAELKKLFGLEQVLWLNHGYLAGDDTDSHTDTLARFCDPHTIAYVKCTRPEDEHYDSLAAMEAELKTFRTLTGKPYRLVALPMADAVYSAEGDRLPATYANFLIINGAVLVPTYELPQDEVALKILADVFPDREIIGINCRTLIEQHGSLHCISMQYPEGVI
jgi:agmatine deiminase